VKKLARTALRYSTLWSDAHPTHVRAVLTTWGKFDPLNQAATDPVYVVALTGRFVCGVARCAISPGSPGETRGRVRGSHIIFTVAVADAPSPGSDFEVDHRDRDLSKLGRILDLDTYLGTRH
jgi:hypothetical protein